MKSTAAAIAFGLASVCSEAVTVQTLSEGTMRMEYLKRREHEHRHAIKRIESNMTTTSALNIVLEKSASKPELKAFIQTSISGVKKSSNLRAAGQLAASDSSEAKDKYDG